MKLATNRQSAGRRRAIVSGLLLCVIAVLLPAPSVAKNGNAQPLKQDEACLACHGQEGMKSDAGKDIFVNPAKHAASLHGVLGCTDCHTAIKDYPHAAKTPKVRCSVCHADEALDLPKSIHGAHGEESCASCHGNAHFVVSAAEAVPGKCAECHAQEVEDFRNTVHGQAAKAGDRDAPTCFSCHGPVHKIVSAGEVSSPVAKKNLPNTCAACHSNPEFLSRHKIPYSHPVESYKLSVHGRAVAAGNNSAASCSDCHGSHSIYAARDARARINHWNVATACAQCHGDIAKTYLSSIHGQAMQASVRDAPVCTDCHGEHLILAPQEAGSTVNASRVSMTTCGRCHGDERLAARYNLPADRVPSYADSYHGLAMREGSQTVANCASCHGVHNIFASSDPRSTVNEANLPKTCGQCHAGAGANFAIGPVHVRVSTGTAHPVVQWIRWVYWILIPITLGAMLFHNAVDFIAKLIRSRPREPRPKVERMSLPFRIVHWGVMISFPTLVYTGFALKDPDAWWAQPVLGFEGHFGFRGALHRFAAILLIASSIYHLIHLAANRRARTYVKAMLPGFRDFADFVNVFRYNFGLSSRPPQFGQFNYAEKIEYWAFAWGTLIMAVTGFLLWFNNFTLRHFPKWVADAATAVHYYEAVLATLSILLWHFYMVIYDPAVYPMDLVWLTGEAPVDHYMHTRPEYVRALAAEKLSEEAPPETPAAAVPAKPSGLAENAAGPGQPKGPESASPQKNEKT